MLGRPAPSSTFYTSTVSASEAMSVKIPSTTVPSTNKRVGGDNVVDGGPGNVEDDIAGAARGEWSASIDLDCDGCHTICRCVSLLLTYSISRPAHNALSGQN